MFWPSLPVFTSLERREVFFSGVVKQLNSGKDLTRIREKFQLIRLHIESIFSLYLEQQDLVCT